MNKLQIINAILWLLEDAKAQAERAEYWEREANKNFQRGGYGYKSYMGTSNDCKKLQDGDIARANLLTLMIALPELIVYNTYFYRLMADEIMIVEVIAPDDFLAVKWAMDNRPLRPFHCRAASDPIPPKMALVAVES